MVYALKQRPENQTNPINLPELNESTLLIAARHIYLTYCAVRPNMVKRPTGVAIDRFTYRGKLLFSKNPILLPQECFVPLTQIEFEIS